MKNLITILISHFVLLSFSLPVTAQPGSLDPTFATNGISTFHFAFMNEKAEDVALTSEGKILALVHSLVSPKYNLIRFQTNGIVDSSFGTNGVLPILTSDQFDAKAITVDASNRILVMSQVYFPYDPQKVYIYRFLSDGSPDLTFGDNGEAETKFMVANNSLLVQPDGKIVAAGQWYSKTRVERFNDDGTIDLSFNLTGYITFNYSPQNNPYGLALDTSNKLLITGWSGDDLFLARLLVDGTYDSTFSEDGNTIIDNGGNETGQDVAVMPDGKIIVTGFSESFFTSSANCWRFLDDGLADNSFGDNGLVKIDSGAYFNFGWFLFPNADSTVIVGGSVYNGRTNEMVLYRLLNDGSKDVTFGINGIGGKTFSSSRYVEINAVRTSEGNIIVCGTRVDNGSNQGVLSQFFPAGSVDSSFAVNGVATFPTGILFDAFSYIYDFTFLPNGEILCAGTGLKLFRLSSTGMVDSSFGKNGVLVPDGQGYEYRQRIAADTNQIYVVTEYDHLIVDFPSSQEEYNSSTFAVLKLHTDGTVDSSYGVSGIAHPAFPGYSLGLCESTAIQPDGKLLVTGLIYAGNSAYGQHHDAYLIRMNTDGSLDNSFGDDGLMVINLSWRDGSPVVSARSDGKIIFAELALDTISANSANKMLRMFPDGSIDSTFGVNGVFTFPVIPSLQGVPLTILPDNKIIVTLYEYNYQFHYSLLRINENGSLDNSFGIGGYSNAPDVYDFYSISDVQLQSDGKIVCGGKTYGPSASGSVSALRLFNSGTVDPTFGNAGISDFDGEDITIYKMRIQPDGKIVLAGRKDFYDFYMIRLLNDIAIGTQNHIPSSSLLLYPDPVSDQLTIENSTSQQEETIITIVNMMGQIMLQQVLKSQGNRISIDVKDFSPGVYTLTLKTVSGMGSVKFIKQ